MKKLLLVLALCACGKAVKNARSLDPQAMCVSRKDDIAFCQLSSGKQVICDNDRCIFVLSPVMLQLEAGTGSKGDR